jgi:ubiquitin-conjugating enzyme E2 variant
MRALEVAAVLSFLFLLGVSIGKIEPTPFLPLAALSGWLLADLFSGVVHWALDTHGSVRTPVVGPAIIRPFREHHADPEGMTRHDFFEVNGASCLGCLPLLALSLALEGFAHALAVFTCLGVLFTNQCHKWAHMKEPPSFVKALQRLRLILRSEEHLKHHTPPYDSHFCTANGWLNKPLDALLK